MNEEIKKYTEMFHNTYEMLAPKYGYETRGDTKQLDFDNPNGKLMYATIEKIVYPILEENQQLKENYECILKQRDDITKNATEQLEASVGIVEHNRAIQEHIDKERELQNQLQQKEDIINKARELLVKWGEEPDADMYMQIKEYKEHRELLEILDNKGE